MKKLTKPEFARLREKTRLALAGRDPTDSYGFVNPPIVRGSTVVYPSTEDFLVRKARYSYGTAGSPTIDALLAAADTMEGGAGVLACSSGLLACTLPTLAFLRAGDHFLVTDSVYHPMRNFCDRMLPRYGVEVTYYDPLIGAGIAELFKPNTRAVWTESPGSQTLEVQDIPAIVAAAHAREIMVMMDNTWAGSALVVAVSTSVSFASSRAGLMLRMMSSLPFMVSPVTTGRSLTARMVRLTVAAVSKPSPAAICAGVRSPTQ